MGKGGAVCRLNYSKNCAIPAQADGEEPLCQIFPFVFVREGERERERKRERGRKSRRKIPDRVPTPFEYEIL